MAVSETHLNSSALDGNILATRRIRPTALGIFWNGDRIFVGELYDPAKGETFYRPLGGGIEFGEHSRDALIREMREETGLEVENLRYLGTFENLFTYRGQEGHEIVLLYEGTFTDPSVYGKETVECCEADGSVFKAVWKRLEEFNAASPFYPVGVLAMLATAPNVENN